MTTATARFSARPAPSFFNYALRGVCALYLSAVVAGVILYKAAFLTAMFSVPWFGAYSVVVCVFILSRFGFSLFHRSAAAHSRMELEPTVAVVMPAFNEESAVGNSVRALLAVDYPEEKLQVVVVNDGSTDGTLREILMVAEGEPRVQVIDFPENRGKRAAMAAGIRATNAEVIAFVDSDSVLDRDALRVIVQGFEEKRVGAIAGHAEVLNARESWITRMQAVRYFVAFRVCKAAESIFGAVTCCSGCFSAYRREAIMPALEDWEHQTFLGRPATYGDDRSLTNYVLRDWKIRYESRALSHTIVPAHFQLFLRQQLRWKKSWLRESLHVSRFIWRKHPVAAAITYMGVLFPWVAPIVVVHAIVWRAVGTGSPLFYVMGAYVMAVLYSLYYAVRRRSPLWWHGITFVAVYMVFLVWQTYYAVATLRNTSWGTRASEHHEDEGEITVVGARAAA
jgi:hyaluronan synthase